MHGNSYTDREGALWLFAGYGGGSGKGIQLATINSIGAWDIGMVIKASGVVNALRTPNLCR